MSVTWKLVSVSGVPTGVARLLWAPAGARHNVTAAKLDIDGKSLAVPDVELAPPKPFSEMPGPPGWPFIGTLWDYMKKDGYSFRKLFKVFQERSSQYGPVYREEIAKRLSVIVSDPVEYAKVVRADGKYPLRMEMEPMVHYRKKRNLCLGTVNSQGEEWHRHRAVVSKKTLRAKEVTDFCVPMSRVAADFVTNLQSTVDQRGRIEHIEFEVFKWALESIGTFIFEERLGCLETPPSERGQRFLQHLIGFFKYMQLLMYDVPIYKLYSTPTWRTYEEHADVVHQLALQFVDKRVAELKDGTDVTGKDPDADRGESETGTSFLTYLLQQTQLPPEEANSHAVDLMIGGVETTSTALVWTLYCLARAPEVQRKAHEEVMAALPADGDITQDVLSKLSYLKACLRETFRLYPITFSTSRILQEDLEIGGYIVPTGTHVQANLYGMGHDRKLFDDPEVFRPERWLRSKQTTGQQNMQAFTNLPWGHGPRMCLGRRIAEQEIYIALSKILRAFDVQYHGAEVQPILNTVMTPDRPLQFTFIPRE